MGLPKFTEFQQSIVVINLINCVPHREIAKHLQEMDSNGMGVEAAESIVLPEGMSQAEYEEAVIKRVKDYVSNKDRKWYQVIKDGRDRYRKRILLEARDQLSELLRLIDELGYAEFRSMDIKDTTAFVDMTGEIREIIHRQVFGDDEDEMDAGDDSDDYELRSL